MKLLPIRAFHRPLLLVTFLFLNCARISAQNTSATPLPDASKASRNADFSAAADEVLAQMSQITGLRLRTPLKKTLRSREEIHSYILRQMNEDKEPAERYASARSAEAFGLLPKGFDFDNFMIELLTEQIAGLYDPKAHEFYIADWIPAEDQRMVMAHELTHALEDQHFQIEAWVKTAKPNDDAELARESVLEGSAMAAMIDYLLAETGRSLIDLPDIDPSLLVGDMGSTPALKKAPPFLKDALIFPYFGGLTFNAALLKDGGWKNLPSVFSKPPVSTQQIMHPELYRSGKIPAVIKLPDFDHLFGSDWTKLEENVMGEFGWKEILKQFLGEDRAKTLAAGWDGDRYVVYEQKNTKRLALVSRLRLSDGEQAARYFGQYSEALEKKYEKRTNLFRRPNFFSFNSTDGPVFLRCMDVECITVEGVNRTVFDSINKAIGWPAAPVAPIDPAVKALGNTTVHVRKSNPSVVAVRPSQAQQSARATR